MNLLVVEDEDSVRLTLARFFAKRGYEVREAVDGSAALKSLDAAPCDVVIADICMPNLDGIGLLKAVKEYHAETEVILVTGQQDLKSAIDAARYKAYDYVTKPYNLSELHQLLKRIESEKRLKAELEAKKRQLDRSQMLSTMGALSTGIMHEINNPNTFISGNAQFLKTKLLPLMAQPCCIAQFESQLGLSFKDLVETIDGILKGSERISGIVRRATAFNAHSLSHQSSVDVHDVLERALRSLEQALTPDIAVVRDLPPPPLKILGNDEAVVQAVVNLLLNAVEALRARGKGRIVLRASQAGAVRIEIEDDGPGIPDSLVDGIFDPFATTKTDRPGRGLGLFIAHQLVMNMHGTLTYGRPESGGSLFTISLPAEPSPSAGDPGGKGDLP